MARDANNARQNKRLQKIQEQYDRDDDESLRTVLALDIGRQVLMRLARKCRWMGDPWDPVSVRLTDYESGRRAAGLDLMAWVERVDGLQFLVMQQEATARDIAAAQTRAAALTPPAQDHDEPEQEPDNG